MLSEVSEDQQMANFAIFSRTEEDIQFAMKYEDTFKGGLDGHRFFLTHG